jgi:elongation factor G
MSNALQRLVEEDPTLRAIANPIQVRRSCPGWVIRMSMLPSARKAKFGVDLVTSVPRIPYRETITKITKVQGATKADWWTRQFGDTWIRFEPLPRGTGFEFTEEVFGGAVPNSFIPAVEKGMREIIGKGVMAGIRRSISRRAL